MILKTEETRHEWWALNNGGGEDLETYETFGDALSSGEPGDSIIHHITTAYVTTATEEVARVPDAPGGAA